MVSDAMISLPLSVLDFGIVRDGIPAGRSVAGVMALARRAEQWGFRRFWVTEHHGSATVSSGAPAIMVARLAGATTSIRIGAGGVMLPNYAPVAVAEEFGTVGALDPGRIDLGIGRGPGSFNPAYVAALRLGAASLTDEEYVSRIRELLGYLAADEDRGVRVTLAEEFPPEPWLLASSAESALAAAELGLPLSFAYHIRPQATLESLAAYRDRFKPSRWQDRPRVMLSVAVTCAETDDMALELARSTQELLTRKAADQPPRAGFFPGSVAGSPETVASGLAELIHRFAPDELILIPAHASLAERTRCLELISERVSTGR